MCYVVNVANTETVYINIFAEWMIVLNIFKWGDALFDCKWGMPRKWCLLELSGCSPKALRCVLLYILLLISDARWWQPQYPGSNDCGRWFYVSGACMSVPLHRISVWAGRIATGPFGSPIVTLTWYSACGWCYQWHSKSHHRADVWGSVIQYGWRMQN